MQIPSGKRKEDGTMKGTSAEARKEARHESAPPTFLARNKEWVVGGRGRMGVNEK